MKSSKAAHIDFPKGAFHSFCRRRIQQEFQAQRLAYTVNTQRKRSLTSRSYIRHTPQQNGQTFEDYLYQIEAKTTRHEANTRNRTAQPMDKRKKSGNESQGKELTKQAVIDSHLPFFKCKLEKTVAVAARNEFRVKEHKFRFNKNIVENNLAYYLGNSLPLRIL